MKLSLFGYTLSIEKTKPKETFNFQAYMNFFKAQTIPSGAAKDMIALEDSLAEDRRVYGVSFTRQYAHRRPERINPIEVSIKTPSEKAKFYQECIRMGLITNDHGPNDDKASGPPFSDPTSPTQQRF